MVEIVDFDHNLTDSEQHSTDFERKLVEQFDYFADFDLMKLFDLEFGLVLVTKEQRKDREHKAKRQHEEKQTFIEEKKNENITKKDKLFTRKKNFV